MECFEQTNDMIESCLTGLLSLVWNRWWKSSAEVMLTSLETGPNAIQVKGEIMVTHTRVVAMKVMRRDEIWAIFLTNLLMLGHGL